MCLFGVFVCCVCLFVCLLWLFVVFVCCVCLLCLLVVFVLLCLFVVVVCAHVVGMAPRNMHIFALPRMKSYA